jgi:O-antigen/teichoic acid export membrane protein
MPVIYAAKAQGKRAGYLMLRLIRWLIYIAVLGVVALAAYAYVGPFFGADFAPPQTEIRQDVTLEAK